MTTLQHRRFKDELYAEFARIGSALGNEKRLEIIDVLAQRERSVEDLASEIGSSTANASRHLRILAAAKLVSTRRNGSFVYYRLAGGVFDLFRALRDIAETRLPEVGALVLRSVGNRARCVDLTAPAGITAHVRARHAIVVDVRPRAEYAAGHLPGAVALPIDTLARKHALRALPRNREIVVYCRGPYCVWADEAVDILRRRGFEAHRLLIGPADWASLGGKLETVVAAAG